MIDLRSDTITKPSAEMLDLMLNAKVGDDVYGEDPTVKKLESFIANYFGMEQALIMEGVPFLLLTLYQIISSE